MFTFDVSGCLWLVLGFLCCVVGLLLCFPYLRCLSGLRVIGVAVAGCCFVFV